MLNQSFSANILSHPFTLSFTSSIDSDQDEVIQIIRNFSAPECSFSQGLPTNYTWSCEEAEAQEGPYSACSSDPSGLFGVIT